MFSDQPENISNRCWLAAKCQLAIPGISQQTCRDLSFNQTLTAIINATCPNLMYMPNRAVAFGHIYFLYAKEDLFQSHVTVPSPRYLCYNAQLCDGFFSNRTSLSFNNATCRYPTDLTLTFSTHGGNRGSWNPTYLLPLFQKLYRCNTVIYHDLDDCNSSIMYRCMNSSKCISKYRICDGLKDCDYNDDEQCSQVNGSCPKYELNKLFKCSVSTRCISSIFVGDGKCDCERDQYGICEDERSTMTFVKTRISFPTICDGFTELKPMIIDESIETDETECQYWQCNNSYTRCDRFWNCSDGADEIGCDPLPLIPCPDHHHICVSPTTYQLICLPLQQANDGYIDCFGATDERKICSRDSDEFSDMISCINNGSSICTNYIPYCLDSLCNSKYTNKLDEEFDDDYCTIARINLERFQKKRRSSQAKPDTVHFALSKMQSEQTAPVISHDVSIIQKPSLQVQYDRCHRGIPLRVWSDVEPNSSHDTCLCPPSYYGEKCEYQNQRVSLTLQFQAYSDSRQTLFALVVTLIDDSNERLIHSHQQFSYLYIRDCQMKFNMYLLYSTQPKNQTKQYAIHIDIYEKALLTYRGSFLIPLEFSFLPVHRVAALFHIPRSREKIQTCSNKQCIHGQCLKYANDFKDLYFCQCFPGWSGQSCTIPHYCTCSSDSLCLARLPRNRSLCVCSADQWGSQCLLANTKCHVNENVTCLNDGRCVPTDAHIVSNKKIKCICQKGFSGERCEIKDTQLIISFDRGIHLTKAILVHFIQSMKNGLPMNGSTFTVVPINQRTVTIHWSYPFQIAFVELLKTNYYLVIVKHTSNHSLIISKTVHPTDRCKHLAEVLNDTIVKSHLLRRMKYYHLACAKQSPLLSCFYDETHFCLCYDYGKERLANCLEFNHTKQFDCFGQSNCRNDAQCLQDKSICPQTSICLCPDCFYGTLCQFSTHGFGLSLDAILGYQIQPYLTVGQQPSAVQISIIIVTIMTIAGCINGILSMMTFYNTTLLKTTCGIFLFCSSITALLIMILFTMKFWILFIAQKNSLTHRLFLQIQCISLDYFLQMTVNMQQWLHACIAIERGITAVEKTHLKNAQRKRIVKYILLILLIFNVMTIVHDPIRRQIITDDNEKRTWCILTYSSIIQRFTTVINVFHFLTPFIINLISAPVIILMTTRQRAKAQTKQTYRQILDDQIRKHRHLIISPLALVILALPRLIISFVSGCMKSIDSPWLYLLGYFISFFPSMLTFLVFVTPSKFYRDEFSKTYRRFENRIRQ